jgi:2-iminoacetate synthase
VQTIHEILAANKLDRKNDAMLSAMDSVTAEDVQLALAQPPGTYDLKRLITLLSPAAADCLEQMATQAQQLTVQRFGRTIQLYAPLYVSNFCINNCLYCGYNTSNKFKRTRLTVDQAVADADIIAAEGFRHILLVSGEDTKQISPEYFAQLADKLKKNFSSISVEIYPMDTPGYKQLFGAGLDGVTLYQETYDRETYKKYHIAGPKSDYDARLDAHDRMASAGMRRLGLGFLLGLSDWRLETLAMAEHGAYLMKKYWRAQVSFSFPRLRPAVNVEHDFKHLVSDPQLVQMMLALRLCFADAGLVLSTRESASFRDNLLNLCITRISAGSKTNPGGYTDSDQSTEQFQIDDDRSPAQIADIINASGKQAVWKDWDKSFSK